MQKLSEEISKLQNRMYPELCERLDYIHGFEDACNEAAQLAEKREGETAWRPIESAPKTRRAILVYCAESKCAFAVYWEELDSQWCIFGGFRESIRPDPTLWMPLPTPPESEAKS